MNQPPEGFKWVWTPDPSWRIEADRTCCRMLADHVICKRPAVASLNRGHQRGGHRYDAWWPYCEEHLYGPTNRGRKGLDQKARAT